MDAKQFFFGLLMFILGALFFVNQNTIFKLLYSPSNFALRSPTYLVLFDIGMMCVGFTYIFSGLDLQEILPFRYILVLLAIVFVIIVVSLIFAVLGLFRLPPGVG